MKIAVLAWGSLVWDPRELRTAGRWSDGGPVLPLEFSRISAGQRLTLVVDEAHGTPTQTLFAQSAFDDLDAAIRNLQAREGMPTPRKIGFVRRDRAPPALASAPVVAAWMNAVGSDAAIWTALDTNFRRERGEEYSVAAALAHLESLSGTELDSALDYIRKAPPQVRTPLRDAVEKRFGS